MAESGDSGKKKVILAIDGSEHSERALHFYLDNLYKDGQEVHLVHALEYPYLPTQRYDYETCEQVENKLLQKVEKEAKSVQSKFVNELKKRKIEYKVHSEFTHPGEYICKVAKEQGVQMICMGTRGMGTIRRTIMGSVSDYVVHHAHCPVMIARH